MCKMKFAADAVCGRPAKGLAAECVDCVKNTRFCKYNLGKIGFMCYNCVELYVSYSIYGSVHQINLKRGLS